MAEQNGIDPGATGPAAPVQIVVSGGTVVTLDAQRRVLPDGAVAVAGGRIRAVGPRHEVLAHHWPARVIDATGGIVLPGLVDAHLHNTQQLARGLADDVDLITWVYDRILPYEACLTDEDTRVSTQLTVAEAIRTGTTCVGDPGGYRVDEVARVYAETGLRGVVAWAGMDRWSGDRAVPDALPGKLDTAATLAEMERVVRTWDGQAGGRIRGAYGLRTEPNASAELLRGAADLADRDGSFVHVHVAVHERQVEWMLARTGRRSVEHLDELGVLRENWLLAHVAAIDDAEVERIAARDAKVTHQPIASGHGAYGAVSRGRIPELLAAGVTVGLGCDANAAGNSLDMFRALHVAATAHKEARVDAGVLSPYRALEMATRDGARALGWDDEIGSLEVGRAADLIVVDGRGTDVVPLADFNLVPNLVYGADGRDVRTTVVAGEVLMEDGRLLTLDVDQLVEDVQRCAHDLYRRLPYRLRSAWPIR